LSEEEVIEEVTYDSEDNDIDDLLTDSDEEDHIKEIRRLTKENTNFNTVSLGDVIEEKKSYAHLMLGKPVVNSEGKKQTLLVTVTPFGEESGGPRKYVNSRYSSVATTNGNDAKAQPKDTKNSNVLSVYSSKNGSDNVATVDKEEKSLLDEISETLEKSNNSILGRRKTPVRETEESSYDINNKENISKKVESEVTNKSERKTTLTRTPALKSRDLEKPILYQTSTARIELLNSKNTRLSAPMERKQPEELNDKNNNKEVVNSLSESDQSLPSTINSTADFIANERSEESKSEQPNEELLAQSREQAGKPDGREDPKSVELPALPLTPPPTLENQASFLHPQANGINSTGNTTSYHPPLYEKPKIPVKPATVLIRKPVASPNINQVYQTLPLTTFVKDPLSKQDSAESDPR